MNRSFLRHSAFVLLTAVLLAVVLSACESGGDVSGKTYTAMRKSTKRGVAFNFSQIEDLPLLSGACSWAYNWGNSQNDNAALWFDTNEMDYCPMVWGRNYDADKIRAYVQAHPKTRYLLAFNEPNLTDQANMTPIEAAAYWSKVVALAKELGLKLVSPAMNYGTLSGYNDPIKWLDEFFAQPGVSIDDVDAIAIHCYMASLSGLKGFIEQFRKYGKPIWLTEFCAWNPVPSGVEKQIDYMCAALNYLEQESLVERYAWFIPRSGSAVNTAPYMQLLTHTFPVELTDLGILYTQFSSFDKQAYLPLAEGIGACQYTGISDCSVSQRVADDKMPYIQALQAGMWVEYQVETTSTEPLQLVYATMSNSEVCVYIDGAAQAIVDMPKTEGLTTWNTIHTQVVNHVGKHIMRIEISRGGLNLKQLKQ